MKDWLYDPPRKERLKACLSKCPFVQGVGLPIRKGSGERSPGDLANSTVPG